MKFSELIRLLQKMGFGPVRGLFFILLKFLQTGKLGNLLCLGRSIRFVKPSNINFGNRVVLGDFGYFDADASRPVEIGNRVTIREFFWIQCRAGFQCRGEGLIIGDNVYIGPYAVIGCGGKVVIGNAVQVGARLSISAENHVADEKGSYVSGKVSRRGVVIEDCVWIGNDVTILDGVKIVSNVVIGAKSLVTKSIVHPGVYVGSPVRMIKAPR